MVSFTNITVNFVIQYLNIGMISFTNITVNITVCP